jgi:Secretion system C-terminal sorting domain
MKKTVQLLLMALLFSSFSLSFGQIMMDGDESDWADVSVAVEAPNNEEGVFPAEVGAIVTDVVDVKEIKTKVIGNVLYGLIRFWGDPAWPNNAYANDHEGTIYNDSRGYYHLFLDLDNDATTGWNLAYYESHYTPVGYLQSLGTEGFDPLGAEAVWGIGLRTNDLWEQENEGKPYVDDLSYWAADVSEYDGETDSGVEYDIFAADVPKPDSSKLMAWEGALRTTDSGLSYWIGHAWGSDFIEFGFELTPMQEYYTAKGVSVLNPGDVIAVASMIETPIDGWGVDMTTRGEVSLPAYLPTRPDDFTFDGDESDWAGVPVAVNAPNNEEGVFPAEVGAIVADRVDIKEVSAKIDDGNIFWKLKMWAGPAWPNDAYQNDHEGTLYSEGRGYYHLFLDLDNNAATGWNLAYYESHFTPVGYLNSLGTAGFDPLGAEAVVGMGLRDNDAWKVANEDADPIRDLEFWAADVSEYDGQTDSGTEYDISGHMVVKDSTNAMNHNGMLVNTENGTVDWMAHAWGEDFIEVGMSLRPIQEYFLNKIGMEYFQDGDVIAVAAMNETPIDGWGVDMTTRGEVGVATVMPDRPTAITFDGDAVDWADIPVAVNAPNNEEGVFPAEVGAIVSDRVDIKEVSAKIDEGYLYWKLTMWAGPAWPNDAYQNDHEGILYSEGRGYYHLFLDLDNDAASGWNLAYYESHYTPVGYLNSLGTAGFDPLGAEAVVGIGLRDNDDWKIANEGATKVRDLDYWAADVSEYDGETDSGTEYDISGHVPPQTEANMFNSLELLVNSEDGGLDWMGHAWGEDFIEVGMSLRPIKEYFMAKSGTEYLKEGDVIAVAAMNETPIDGWGVDMTTRGEVNVTIVGVNDNRNNSIENKFALENNYPNPFNPTTSINFSVPNLSKVSLVIYNTLGQKVKTLINNNVLSGNQTTVWNGKNEFGSSVPSGVYYYRIESGSNSITKSMVLLK